MYVKYGAGAKPFNKGSFSFLIAFARQLEQALEERPDELEDTMGCLANAMAYLTGEDAGFLPGPGGDADGIDDVVDTSSGVQDEVETRLAGGNDGRGRYRNAGVVERAVGRVVPEAIRVSGLPPGKSKVPMAMTAKKGGKRRGKRTKR